MPATIDLSVEDWLSIQKAARESTWMPKEYVQNDWVADVCSFLREGPTTFYPKGSGIPTAVALSMAELRARVGNHLPCVATVDSADIELVCCYLELQAEKLERCNNVAKSALHDTFDGRVSANTRFLLKKAGFNLYPDEEK